MKKIKCERWIVTLQPIITDDSVDIDDAITIVDKSGRLSLEGKEYLKEVLWDMGMVDIEAIQSGE